MQGHYASIGLGAVLVAGMAAFADRRRQRRRNLDAVGFMPWPVISLFAVIIALFSFAFAIIGR